MSSTAGKLSFPFVGAHAASKHALEGMSSSLRRELMMYGIDVIVLGKGLPPHKDHHFLKMEGSMEHIEHAEQIHEDLRP